MTRLTKNNYYSPEMAKHFFTASFCKAMLSCEAQAVAEWNGTWSRPASSALLIGSYVDAAFESVPSFERFKSNHPEIMKRDGTLKAEFSQADEMINRAKQDPVFMRFMKGQHQKILTGEIEGFPFKAKLDILQPKKAIIDLKTVKSFESVYVAGSGRVSFAEVWHWPLQMAIYQKLEGHGLPCFLACITKENPPDIEIIEIPQEMMDAEMDLLMERLSRYDAIRNGLIEPERCGKCPYCRETKKLTEPRSLAEFEFE